MRTLLVLLSMASCRSMTSDGPRVDDSALPEVVTGELTITQLYLSGLATGEAALLVAPDGTSVLIDLGNDSHDDDVLDQVQATLGEAAVDYVLITHFHGDHVGAADTLLSGELSVRQGLVWRGTVDLTADSASEEAGEIAGLDLPGAPLCAGGSPASCDLPTLDLGGATLQVLAVNGQAGGEVLPIDDDENARSIVGLVRMGAFAYLFGGDLTGGGKDTPDLESFVVAHSDLPPGGVDVIKLNHHGIDSSSNQAWLDALLPDDGRDRNAVVGSNHIYLSSPDQDVLDRIGGRLGGGRISVTELGSLAGEHSSLCEAAGPVTVRVLDGGDRYAVTACGEERAHEAVAAR